MKPGYFPATSPHMCNMETCESRLSPEPRIFSLPNSRSRNVAAGARLKKEMATHSSTLAWRIPKMEEPGRLQFKGSQRVDMTKRLSSAHIMRGIHLVICTMSASCEFLYFCQQCNGHPVLLIPDPHSHLLLPPPSSINVQYKHGNVR